MYPKVMLHIAGQWRDAGSGDTRPIINPATAEEIGTHPVAGIADLDEALEAAERGFKLWRTVSAFERGKIMRKAADLLRTRVDEIARIMTLEQGKPLAEAKGETLAAADVIDWFAEEGKRAYGRVIPARADGVMQLVIREPVGPVAAFTPWNFPINQAVRKVSAALCTGCSVILKGPEDTPGSCAELVRAYLDAGVPATSSATCSASRPTSRTTSSRTRYPQGDVHGLDPGRQAARGVGRPAHEAGHDGTRRARARDRVQGRRPR
jgi:succinate-semialdehyde dehydrogenase/glutarate-semialdehyde dehydrogenase